MKVARTVLAIVALAFAAACSNPTAPETQAGTMGSGHGTMGSGHGTMGSGHGTMGSGHGTMGSGH